MEKKKIKEIKSDYKKLLDKLLNDKKDCYHEDEENSINHKPPQN
jgi:hypothetical protein